MIDEKLSNIDGEKIQEAETETSGRADSSVVEAENLNSGVTEETNLNEKAAIDLNKKKDFYIELVLIFILGILIGIAVKTEADKKITIGFNDYQMKIAKQDFNINQLQADVTKKSMEQSAATNQDATGQQNGAAPTDGNASGN